MSDTVQVELLKRHTRGGLALLPGTRIEIPRQKLEWFVNTGTAREVKILRPRREGAIPPPRKRDTVSPTEE